MRISLSITTYPSPPHAADLGAELTRIAVAADRGGLDTVWVPDHLIQAAPNTSPEAEMLEAYTTLGYLTARTERIKLGTMVTGVTFRPPGLLIKAVTTLDVLSGGRVWFGVGTGHHEGEALSMGLPFPPLAERYERLEETLRLALQMWSGYDAPFDGKHYRLEQPLNSPNTLRDPHPPILIGGMGEQKTLRLVAQYADACNLFDIPDGGATVRRKLDVLGRHCEEVGRRYDEIEKTISTRLEAGESADSFVRRCAAFAELGIEHAVVITDAPWTEESVAVLTDAQRSVSSPV